MNRLDVQLLRALRESRVHLTTADLAEHTGAEQRLVKQRLDELAAAGFEMEDRPGYGFRLIASPDRLIADDLVARLEKCLLIREILVFEQLESTNDFALQRGRQGGEGGLVVFAERQTSGRGRFGRRWESAAHRGLWFTLLLRPALPQTLWPRLTTWAAVAVACAVEAAVRARTSIKWPNDVYLEDRKVAGILAESGNDDAGRPFAVVGIGINVNHQTEDFPEELSQKAGSLRQFSGGLLDRCAFAADVLRALDAWHSRLIGGFGEIVDEVRWRSSLLGCRVQVKAGEELLEGFAEEIDPEGHLILRDAAGVASRLTAGEVVMIARS